MIGFAPAGNPQIAVAVVVPESNSSDGAHMAGPIMKDVMMTAVPPGSVSQPCGV
jgi:cell division protein FtsI/penicillin-binding protein 2